MEVRGEMKLVVAVESSLKGVSGHKVLCGGLVFDKPSDCISSFIMVGSTPNTQSVVLCCHSAIVSLKANKLTKFANETK